MADEDEGRDRRLPANVSSLKRQLMAAASSLGTARGTGAFLKIDDRNGAWTVGGNADPFPMKARYLVDMRRFEHGFVVFGEEGGTRESMVRMVDQPVKPIPPGGRYVERFGEPGPKDCLRIFLANLDEPGDDVKLDAFGKSSKNRVRQLYYEGLAHLDTEAGERGYVHPVITPIDGHYFHKTQGREVHHFDYRVADWMSDAQGVGLLSEAREALDGSTLEGDWSEVEEPSPAPRQRKKKSA